MNICPNAYYNYLKNKKHEYYQNQRLSVGYLREAKEQTIFKSRKIFQRAGKFTSLDRQKFKYSNL